MTKAEYLFSCEGGLSIRATEEQLDKPLITSLSSSHSSLTLRDCFSMVEKFADEHEGRFVEAVSSICDLQLKSLDKAETVTITSEKLGAFYHIFSVTIRLGGREVKLAVSLAFSDQGRTCLEKDFGMLVKLSEQAGNGLFPRPFFMHGMNHERTGINFVLAVSQWLDGFYEWHLSRDPGDGRLKIIVWDTDRQYFFLPEKAENDLFRQISRVLTLCHNPFTGDQICLWHNAAGDFIVRFSRNRIDTRLTTIREYRPLFALSEHDPAQPELNTLYFLLDMAVRIRLDRLDGIGEPVWLDRKVLPQVFAGFREGCALMAQKTGILSETADNVVSLIREFSSNDLLSVYEALVPAFMRCSDGDYELIKSNLHIHADELRAAAL